MVLQRQMPVPVWGWANAGEAVTVTFAGQIKKVVAGDDGKWQTVLDPMPASAEGRDLIVGDAASTRRITLHDVLVGEVWLCSGQSNMEWGVGLQPDGKAIIAAAEHPSIRLFVVAHGFSYQPKDDLPKGGADFRPNPRVKGGLQPVQLEREKNAGTWRPCTPANIDLVGWKGFSAAAYFFAVDIQEKLHVPVGLIQASYGGSNLKSFVPPEGFAQVPSLKGVADGFPQFVHLHPQVEGWYPGAKYNDMIHPIVPFAIRGALWHQGETDVGGSADGSPYFEGMKALIGGWRKVWGEGDFPFYYVMTGPFRDWKNDDLPHHWMSQLAALSIPNTGYVVTTDCGEPWDLHPHNKDIVGHRLALWALAKTYGFPDLVYSGPLYRAAKIEGHGIRVSFDSVGGGLKSRDGQPLTHFEIAGADGVFVPAVARIEGQTLLVTSESVAEPKDVRFAWTWEHPKRPAPVPSPNFVNKEGLPAAPFNTRFVK